MSGAFRMAAGGRIDRAKALRFTFDGVAYRASPATRWPRRCSPTASIWSAGPSNIIARAGSSRAGSGRAERAGRDRSRRAAACTPNLRATEVELYDGLAATSQNRWPSLTFDVGAINDVLSPLFGAGFYYKTFMGPDWLGPSSAWRGLYEPAIRRAAGLGAAPTTPDPDAYAQYFAHCDVLVVGAGPAGLARRACRGEERRARSSCATSRTSSAARCLARRAP